MIALFFLSSFISTSPCFALPPELTAPQIHVSELFSEVVISSTYKSWEVHGIGSIQLWPKTGQRQKELSRISRLHQWIPVSPTHSSPVLLTKETLPFFSHLPSDDLRELPLDGSYCGYQYLFFPSSVRNPEIKVSSGEPIPFYLLKKVPTGIDPGFLATTNLLLETQETEQSLKRMYENYWLGINSIKTNPIEASEFLFQAGTSGHVEALYEYALILNRNRETLAAKSILIQLARDYPYPKAQVQVSKLLIKEGRRDEALIYLTLAADKHRFRRAQLLLAEFFQSAGKPQQAELYYRDLYTEHNDVYAQYQLGKLLESQERWKEARALYEKVKSHPRFHNQRDFFDIDHRIQTTLKKEKAKEAIRILKRQLTDPDPEKVLEAKLHLAELYEDLPVKPSLIKTYYREVIDRSAQIELEIKALLRLGQYLFRLKDYISAQVILNKCAAYTSQSESIICKDLLKQVITGQNEGWRKALAREPEKIRF